MGNPMGLSRWVIAVAIGLWIASTPIAAQLPRPPLALEPLGSHGEAVFPAFEGWGSDKNGDTVLLLGYYNRNKAQEFDVPIGPDNRIGPGCADAPRAASPPRQPSPRPPASRSPAPRRPGPCR